MNYSKPLSTAATKSDKTKRQKEGTYFIKGFLTLICAIWAHTIKKAISKKKDPQGENGDTATMNPKKESTIRSKLLSIFEESAFARLTKLRIEIINTDILIDTLLMDLECITFQGE